MIYKKVLVPYHQIVVRGRPASPLRMIPENENKLYPIKYTADQLGIDGVDIRAEIAFEFVGDAYRSTWKYKPGQADIEIRWQTPAGQMRQIVDATLTRKFEKDYWTENWRDHCYYKNSAPEKVKYYLPELLKVAHCPLCTQPGTMLVLPYNDVTAGWSCVDCAQPEFGEIFDYRRRQDTAMKKLVQKAQAGEFS